MGIGLRSNTNLFIICELNESPFRSGSIVKKNRQGQDEALKIAKKRHLLFSQTATETFILSDFNFAFLLQEMETN